MGATTSVAKVWGSQPSPAVSSPRLSLVTHAHTVFILFLRDRDVYLSRTFFAAFLGDFLFVQHAAGWLTISAIGSLPHSTPAPAGGVNGIGTASFERKINGRLSPPETDCVNMAV